MISKPNADMLTKLDRLAPLPSEGRARALPSGYRLAHLEIQQVLGEGGFSLVYQAFDRLRLRPIALKEYFPTAIAIRNARGEVIPRNDFVSSTFNMGREYFHQEADILADLSHPAIPQLLGFWQENNTAYIAMPLYGGNNLKQQVAQTPSMVTLSWLKTLLAGLLDTVNSVHLQGYLHLDISWDNIQLQTWASPILLDFGSACVIGSHCQKKSNMVLKPGFSPAELYYPSGGEKRGPWSDIYSLGALMYTLIAGRLPPVSLTRCIEDKYLPLAQQQLEGYPLRFLRAIDGALSVNAASRPQSIDAFCQQLAST